MSNRNALLNALALHYEVRAEELDEFARRYGHLQGVNMDNLKAQAMAFREAAAYAHQQKDGRELSMDEDKDKTKDDDEGEATVPCQDPTCPLSYHSV